ncbi:MAG: ASPIC/UnbV domain-containing protein, partial [Bacteroidota bacterium]
EWVYPNGLYENSYPDPYTEISASANVDAEMYGMGIAVGDYDHDRDLDYYVTNIGWNGLFDNNGSGSFSERGGVAGVRNDSVNGALTTGWGTAWLDYDLDGWQDLVCANGHILLIDIFENATADPNKLWHNNGDGTFTDVSVAMGVDDTASARGLAIADYDNDGDHDFMTSVIALDTPITVRSRLYRNDNNNGNHYLKVRVQGTYNNRDGFGTQLVIHANGTSWVHEVNGGSSHMSQNSSAAIFGLGSATSADSLFVIWPDGNVQLLQNIPADTSILVIEDSLQFLSTHPFLPPPFETTIAPNPFQDQVKITVRRQTLAPLHLEIVDLMGKVVLQRAWPAGGSETVE